MHTSVIAEHRRHTGEPPSHLRCLRRQASQASEEGCEMPALGVIALAVACWPRGGGPALDTHCDREQSVCRAGRWGILLSPVKTRLGAKDER